MGINKWALEKWIEALRSGEYKQGHESLCKVDTNTGERYYCCLGVAASVLGMGEWGPSDTTFTTAEKLVSLPYGYEWHILYGSLPVEVWDAIGLPSNIRQNDLIKWNDEKALTFNEIADRLEEYLDE